MKPRRLFFGMTVLVIVMPLLFISLYSTLETITRKSRTRKFMVQRLNEGVSSIYSLRSNDSFSLESEFEMGENKTFEQSEVWDNRVKNLRAACSRLEKRGQISNSVRPQSLDHIIVDDRYKVMYCYIPKVACTNMKRVFLLLTGKMNTTNPLDIKGNDVHFTYDKYLKYLSKYKKDEINYRISNYKKLIFVREPLERLLSAYRNKFLEKSDYFHKRFGRRIIKHYRRNPSIEATQRGSDVRFIEFVKYLLDPDTIHNGGYNEHWAHYTALCHPCLIQYDFIGKYETIDQDVDHVLTDLNIQKFIKFPPRGATYKKKKTKDTMIDFFRTIPPMYLRQLWRIYVNDYKMFDYAYPDVLKELLN